MAFPLTTNSQRSEPYARHQNRTIGIYVNTSCISHNLEVFLILNGPTINVLSTEGSQGFITITLPIKHLVYITPFQILHKNCFQFLLGITVVPKERKSNVYAFIYLFFSGGGGVGKEGAFQAMRNTGSGADFDRSKYQFGESTFFDFGSLPSALPK